MNIVEVQPCCQHAPKKKYTKAQGKALDQAVTFTATVTSAGPTPTGQVRFKDGTTAIGTATLNGGVAKLTKAKLAVGAHPITVEYLGDAASAKSTSSVLNQVVQ